MKRNLACVALLMVSVSSAAQNPPVPFSPQPILQGGQVIPLFPPGSRYLKTERIGNRR